MQESTDRTRTEKNREIKDQAGPGPTKFGKSPTEPDQDQKKIRKSRTKSDRSVLGPGGSWIPASRGIFQIQDLKIISTSVIYTLIEQVFR